MSELDRLLARARVPHPPAELRQQVLRAIAEAASDPPLTLLDRLWASSAWWLGWSLAMVLLVLAQTGGTSHPPGRLAESLQRQRSQYISFVVANSEQRETHSDRRGGRRDPGPVAAIGRPPAAFRSGDLGAT